MITNQHNDGGCYKLTVRYCIDPESPEQKYIMYGEDFDELWDHYKEVRHLWDYVRSFTIEDDSK